MAGGHTRNSINNVDTTKTSPTGFGKDKRNNKSSADEETQKQGMCGQGFTAGHVSECSDKNTVVPHSVLPIAATTNQDADLAEILQNLVQEIKDMKGRVERVEQGKVTERPPVQSICKGGLDAAVMSEMTSAGFLKENENSILKEVEPAVGKLLKDYIKKYWYSDMKFPQGDMAAERICQLAVRETKVMMPPTINEAQFCGFFKKNVAKALTSLRNNSQTLARKNWNGK